MPNMESELERLLVAEQLGLTIKVIDKQPLFSDRTNIQSQYSDIDPLTCFNSCDFPLENRRKNILIKAASEGPEVLVATTRVLKENEKKYGTARKRNSCMVSMVENLGELTPAEMSEATFNESLALKAKLLAEGDPRTTTNEDIKNYMQVFSALEVAVGLARPSYFDTSAKTVITNLCGEKVASGFKDEKALAAGIPEEVIPSFFGTKLSTTSPLPSFLEGGEEKFIKYSMSSTRHFSDLMYGKAKADIMDFDWTKAVFINGRPLHDIAVEEEKNLAKRDPEAHRDLGGRAFEAMATKSFIGALMVKENAVECLPYLQDQKKFDTKPLSINNPDAADNDFAFEQQTLENPKMNWLQRLLSHFGFYKDTREKQDAFDRSNTVSSKAAEFNKEIESKTLSKEVEGYQTKVDNLLNTIFTSKSDRDFVELSKTNHSFLSPLNAVVAYLSTEHDMTIEQILDEKYSPDLKKAATDGVKSLYDNSGAASVDAMAKTAIKMLNSKTEGDYTKGSSMVAGHYDEMKLKGDFLTEFSEIAPRRQMLSPLLNWCKSEKNRELLPEEFHAKEAEWPEDAISHVHFFIAKSAEAMGRLNHALTSEHAFNCNPEYMSRDPKVLEDELPFAMASKFLVVGIGEDMNKCQSMIEIPLEMSRKISDNVAIHVREYQEIGKEGKNGKREFLEVDDLKEPLKEEEVKKTHEIFHPEQKAASGRQK